MKILLTTTLLLLLLAGNAAAQKILTIDFDKIKKEVKDKNSSFYYPRLLTRLESGDTSLTKNDFKHLYYGNASSESYNPYYSVPAALRDFLKAKNFKDAIPVGLQELEHQPTNLRLNYYLLICYDKIGDVITARKFAARYYGLLDAISTSGDGKTLETAFVVLNVSDEYEFLSANDLSSNGQALIGSTDRLTINQDDQKKEPKIKELYFNVEMSFIHMEAAFKK